MPATERERPPRPLPDQPPSTDPAIQQAHQDLAEGILLLTSDWTRMTADFVSRADQIAGDEATPPRIQVMMNLSREYHQKGLALTPDTVDRTAAIPIQIERPHRQSREIPGERVIFKGERPPIIRNGFLVSIVGAEGRDEERRLQAIALMDNGLGQELFVPVSLSLTGRALVRPEIYYPDFQERYNTPISKIEALFPPKQRNQGRDGEGRRSPESSRGRFHGESGGGRFRG